MSKRGTEENCERLQCQDSCCPGEDLNQTSLKCKHYHYNSILIQLHVNKANVRNYI
jgi:hypothetical protein